MIREFGSPPLAQLVHGRACWSVRRSDIFYSCQKLLLQFCGDAFLDGLDDETNLRQQMRCVFGRAFDQIAHSPAGCFDKLVGRDPER